jgi:hypothetical protein
MRKEYSTTPKGDVATAACAYLERLDAIVETTGQKIKSLTLGYEELGEYRGHCPRPTLTVNFYNDEEHE